MSLLTERPPAILGGTPIRPNGPPEWPADDAFVRSELLKLIDSRDWGRYHGPHVPDLCRRLADYHGVEHVLPCSSGTAAVELALRGVGVTADDEVILAGYDFKANFQNVLCLRAMPVLVDLHPETWQLDPARLEAAVSSRTRAILVSHLHGGMVDAPHVRQIAEAHGIALIEDACQSPGAKLYGRVAGTWGDVGVLSFGGSKLLTAGRGGAVITSRNDIAERIKRYVQRGNDAYPLSEMQAAIVCPQLDQLDARNEHRRDAVRRLSLRLSDVTGLTPLQIPTVDVQPTYYKVGFRYQAEDFAGLPRDLFAQAMRAEGIAFDAGFRGLHLIHASRRFRAADDLREASRADAEMLTLHHPVLLEADSAIEEIASAVHKVREWAAEIMERKGRFDTQKTAEV
ncbi:MAG: aminotransferase class V-fold PLP-dependent enzyme [Candidatus Saccharimonas sp.]|nr:aminotransferase class V-fold PLP-dependent enzyme [Planctomycetaceae bacterium]